jgi:hypothetical protein
VRCWYTPLAKEMSMVLSSNTPKHIIIKRTWFEGRTLANIRRLRKVWYKFFLPFGADDVDEDYKEATMYLVQAFEHLKKYEAKLKVK